MKSVGGMLWDMWCGMNAMGWMLMAFMLVTNAASWPKSCIQFLFVGLVFTGTMAVAWAMLSCLPFMHDIGQEIDQRLAARKVKHG